MITSDENVSQVSLKCGQSPRGMISKGEFVKAFKLSTKWGVALAAFSAASYETGQYLLSNIDKIYTGPGAASIAALAGAVAFWLKMKVVTDKAFEEGDGP